MKNIFLVRHGQASAGTSNYDRLSKMGIKQAELLGDYWKKSGFELSAAFSGSLERQQHTAELALTGVADRPVVCTLETLNEYNHTTVDRLFGRGITVEGDWNLNFDQYLTLMRRWHDAGSETPVDAESWLSFTARGLASVEHAVTSTDSTSIALFTSGGVIATILQQIMGLSFEQTIQAIWQIRNASVTHLQIDDTNLSSGQSFVVDYNCVPHLQLHHDASLITKI